MFFQLVFFIFNIGVNATHGMKSILLDRNTQFHLKKKKRL